MRDWASLHRAELEHNWARARDRQPLDPIDPLASHPLDVTHASCLDHQRHAVIGEHKLRLLFEDGTVGDVSFERDAWNGVFAPLQDPGRFANVSILNGTLYWPEDELDWAPEPLDAAARTNALIAA